ncbi:glycosyltransferase [Cellulosilyticum ruminicola]|uniref:glycosyltransferase n=1 Tax=Cellulosilyticum ruminicola TaxID=425254 RepID=UPI0006CF6DC5|nr:glycosyltransferase [Cellulosilyticum ruminicola]
MSHVLLVTHWTAGDVYPFIKLGAELLKEGHRVTVFSHCVYEKKAKEEGLEFVALDTPSLYEAMNNDLNMLADPIKHRDECIYFQNKYHGKERLIEECKLIEAHCTDKETIILARHRSSISGMLVAERLKLPYATVVLAPNYFAHMDLHEEIFGNSLKEEINKAREVLDLPAISSWKQWLYSPKYILGIWPEWFAQKDESWPEGVYPVGYIKSENKQADEEGYSEEIDCLLRKAKLDNKPIVLISGGSSKMLNPLFYEVTAKACEIAGYLGILVTRYEEMVPNPLSDNIIWAKYVPLAALMKEVDVIIHHGGMGTLSEAVDAAIPQIILPHLADRLIMHNA